MQIATRTLLAKSCASCGHFKQGASYRRTYQGYWDSYCSECHTKHSVTAQQKRRAESRIGAWNTGEQWTYDEVMALREMTRQNVPLKIIGKKLGRPLSAVSRAKTRYL